MGSTTSSPGSFTLDGEIVVDHCGLEALLIQIRPECVTLCIGELTRVCGVLQNSSSSRKIRFSMEILSRSWRCLMSVSVKRTWTNLVQCLSVAHIIGRRVRGNQDQNLVCHRDRSLRLRTIAEHSHKLAIRRQNNPVTGKNTPTEWL